MTTSRSAQEVNFLDSAYVWAASLQTWMRTQGIDFAYGRSEDTRPKQSCWINVRSGNREADLVLWDTGEAELALADPLPDGVHEHIQLSGVEDLGRLLSRLINIVELRST